MKKESSRAGAALMKTRSSGAGAGAMFMKRRAPEPELWHFLRRFHSPDYLYNPLAPQTISVDPEPKFQAPAAAPPSKSFWLRLQPFKTASAPGSGSRSTALLRTRLIHISSSCWTIYRSFKIILETGTVHWIELQIQCSMQIHCFKKH